MIGHRKMIDVSNGPMLGEGPPSIVMFSAQMPMVVSLPGEAVMPKLGAPVWLEPPAALEWYDWDGFSLAESSRPGIVERTIGWMKSVAGKIWRWASRIVGGQR